MGGAGEPVEVSALLISTRKKPAACCAAGVGAERQSSWDYSTVLAPRRYGGVDFQGELVGGGFWLHVAVLLPQSAVLLPSQAKQSGQACRPVLAHPPCLAADLPGFTRSFYNRNHALVAPESQVYAGNPLWCVGLLCTTSSPALERSHCLPSDSQPPLCLRHCPITCRRHNALTAHTISPVVGANFAMYLASLKANSSGSPPAAGIER